MNWRSEKDYVFTKKVVRIFFLAREHCAVRLVSIVLELAIGISYIKNVANFMQNVNPLTEIWNGLSHTLYQIKKYKNWQIYDMFGIFGIFLENIANNKSGTLMLAGMTPWYELWRHTYCLGASLLLMLVNTSQHQSTRFVIGDILRNYTENAKLVIYLLFFVFFNLVKYMA